MFSECVLMLSVASVWSQESHDNVCGIGEDNWPIEGKLAKKKNVLFIQLFKYF